MGGNFGSYATDLPGAVSRNITDNVDSSVTEVASALIMPAFQTALVGAGFKIGKKLTRKPRSAINRQLKAFGFGRYGEGVIS